MTRSMLLVASSLAVACGSTPAKPDEVGPTTETRADDAETQAPGAPLEVSGVCGGFETRSWAADPVGLLNDHLRITPIVGLVPSERAHNIMAAPHPEDAETRLFLEDEQYKLVVFAQELYRAPGDDLAGAMRALDEFKRDELETKTLESGLRVVIDTPAILDTGTEAVLVASAYVASADGTVQAVSVYVNPAVVETGSDGCADMAHQILGTLAPGERAVDLGGGPRDLDGLVLDLPANYMMVRQQGPDFTVFRVYPVLPFGKQFGALVLYFGEHPSVDTPDSATSRAGTILGNKVQWSNWTDGDASHSEALVKLGTHNVLHAIAMANDDQRLQALVKLVERGLRAK